MPRILTVDDSRAVRMVVAKQVQELGFEVDEAENGEEGLAKLEDMEYDLVLLDVTMPVLDGPGMLAKLRESGNKTPVLMLTSESKRSIVATLMKLGIDDYILKPFKSDELKRKMLKAMKLGGDAVGMMGEAAAAAPPAMAAPAAPSGGGSVNTGSVEGGPGRKFIDILLIDDMENVAKKFRTSIPPHLTLNSCISAQSALNVCRETIYRVILIDNEMPDVSSAVLMNQLRVLQPHATFVALALRSANNVAKEARELGFNDLMFKPFQPEAVEDFLLRYFDNQEILTREDNLLKVGVFRGKADRLERYFSRLSALMKEAIEKLAAACFEDMIIDLTQMPSEPQRTAQLLMEVDAHSSKFGIALRLVGSPEVAKVLKTFTETAKMPVYSSISDARAA